MEILVNGHHDILPTDRYVVRQGQLEDFSETVLIKTYPFMETFEVSRQDSLKRDPKVNEQRGTKPHRRQYVIKDS